MIVVGASGTIGQAVVSELAPRHDMVRASRSGDVQVNITDAGSIRRMFEAVGSFDALVSTTGSVHFGDFMDMSAAEYAIGLNDKLMGQVNLVLIGREFVNDAGSFTLTSGVLGEEPIRYGSSASMTNGAVDAFVRAAAIEMPRGIRINCVSPGVIEEAMDAYGPYFRGFEPVPVARAALAYSKSVEGLQTGRIYRVY